MLPHEETLTEIGIAAKNSSAVCCVAILTKLDSYRLSDVGVEAPILPTYKSDYAIRIAEHLG